MTTAQAASLGVLYEQDETAWLETMAELIRRGRLDEVDYPNLAEYLADMARREAKARRGDVVRRLLQGRRAGRRRDRDCARDVPRNVPL